MMSCIIQTHSIESILKPLAEKVTTLLQLTENPHQNNFTKLINPAESIWKAVKDLTAEGLELCKDSEDREFYKEMTNACARCSHSALVLTEEMNALAESGSDTGGNCKGIYDALQGILDWMTQILLSWDAFEVRNLVSLAYNCHDRLRLVEAARSMRGLLVCYTGFTESMETFIAAARLREKDMINVTRRDRLSKALMSIQENLQALCTSTIESIRNPTLQRNKHQVVTIISLAIQEIIRVISGNDYIQVTSAIKGSSTTILPVITDDTEDTSKSGSSPLTTVTPSSRTSSSAELEDEPLAMNIVKVVENLSTVPPSHAPLNPKLDLYISAIMTNSKAVADVSKEHYKHAIMGHREKILALRETLSVNFNKFQNNPNNEELEGQLNHTSDLLCATLLELDKLVAQSVADQVAETFVDLSKPMDDLIKAVVSTHATNGDSSPNEPSSTMESLEDDDINSSDVDRNIKLFRRRSLKLSEVAVQAAQGTIDRKRAKQVKVIAGELTDLTSPVLSTALKAKQDGGMDVAAQDTLQDLSKQWGDKAIQLKEAVDEIISPLDFTAATEANIAGEMSRCREAINSNSWSIVQAIAQSIAAKGQRLLEVGASLIDTAVHNPAKRTLIQKALEKLKEDIEVMLDLADHLSDSNCGKDLVSKFVQSLKNVLHDIHSIQHILPDTSIAGSLPPKMKRASLLMEDTPPLTSTPISAPPPYGGSRQHGGGSDEGRGSPILRVFNNNGPSPYPIPGTGRPRPLEPADDSVSLGIQTMPINQMEGGPHRADLSPSDNWIMSKDSSNSPSTTFAPTIASIYEGYNSHVTPPTSRQGSKVKNENMVQYPTSIEGLNVTKLTNQSDFSLTSDWDKEDKLSTSHTPQYMSIYTQPLQSMLTAANDSDTSQLDDRVVTLNTRTNRLIQLADTAANTVTDQDLASVLQQKSAHLSHITPQIIRQAKHKATDPASTDEADLDRLVHQWTGHVGTLLDASQRANLPWSHTTRRLVSSAKQRKGLAKEIDCITNHTQQMVNVANSSIEAATTEDNIGSTSNLHELDPDIKKEIQKIRDKIEDIETITPNLISSAQQAATDTVDEGEEHVAMAMEKLNLLSHEWATTASALMKDVDNITMGMSGPADSLVISVRAGDPALLSDQCQSILELSESMLTISKDSVMGCSEQQVVDTVLGTGDALIKVAHELVDCANNLSKVRSRSSSGEQERQVLIEQAEIQRRDWSAKMHLLTAHIDDLTANVAGPLDRLVSIALQASRTEGMAKEYLSEQFDEKSEFTRSQLEIVNEEVKNIISELPDDTNTLLQKCSVVVTFMVQLSPQAIEAAKNLSTDPSSAKLDKFSYLRRQWASKAQSFKANLNSLDPNIDTAKVEIAFHELLQGHKTIRRRSVTPSALDGYKHKSKRDEGGEGRQVEDKDGGSGRKRRSLTEGMFRSYSDEDLRPPPGPAPPPPVDDDDDDKLPKTPIRLTGFSEPATPQQDAGNYLVTPVSKVIMRDTQRSFTPELRSKKHLSMGTLPSWTNQSRGDDSIGGGSFMDGDNSLMNTSTGSIAVAARNLKETADQFMEEGNPFIGLAKTMSEQMFQMSQFARGKGELQTKSDMISTAKAVAANAEQIARYARSVSKQCLDERMKVSLQSSSDMIPTLSTQLKIIASVKSCNPNDISADVMLVKNAQNLMQAVIETIQAAEAAYMKGLKPSDDSTAEFDSAPLAVEWKRKLYIQRTMETISAPMGPKGLRKLNKNRFSTPSLAEMIHSRSRK